MRCFVARNAKRFIISLVLLAGVATVCLPPTNVFAQSSVYATLCGAASQITITQPASDSTVTAPQVTVSGSVAQANQVEVYVDDAFDSTVPLTIGQTTYSSEVQLPSGTHTIRVEAINSCGGQNGEATSVVTFATPPTQPSSGQGATTQVAPSQGGAVRVGAAPTVTSGVSGEPVQESVTPFGLPPIIGKPLERTLEWLNITNYDTKEGVSGLSIGRAAFVVLGMYLLVLGVAPTLVHALAGLRVVAAATPRADKVRRYQLVQWGVRGLGLLILLLALFL